MRLLSAILAVLGFGALGAGVSALPVMAQEAGNADEGAKIFRRCQACHTVTEGQHRVGPSLYGVVGRQSATAEGFPRYSDAMKASDITWTEENISKYLENPRAFIPGNIMAFPGLRKEQDRLDVIAFLERAAEAE
ncbi:c-type cytochrome [Iodidimonas nitroreducens]|nr:cytochrome c family protein [Iodidimonas nitroreducens]